MTHKNWLKLSLFTVFMLAMMACGLTELLLDKNVVAPEDAIEEAKIDDTISIEDAIKIILTDVVKPDDLNPEEQVIVFSWPEIITPDDQLQPYLGPNFESPGEVLPYDGWFFWVDYTPWGAFAHPTLYVFVDPLTGEVSTSDQEWWPLLNGEGLWVNTIDYWDEANWAFSWIEWRPSSLEGITITIQPEPSVQQNGNPGAALVVNGWSLGQTLKEDSQYNADGMIDALLGTGYNPDYLGPQAYFNPESIREWIADQSLELEPGQTATIYITGHGGNVDGKGRISVGGYLLYEEDLALWLAMFNPGVNVVVILDACNSGSFIDGLSEVANMVITSTDAEHISAGDYDPLYDPDSEVNDPNPDDLGTEFSSGLIEDYNEIMADPARVEQVRAIAEGNNISFTQALWGESWYSAVAKDVTYLRGLTFPQIFRSVPLSLPPIEEIITLDPLPPETVEIVFYAPDGQELMGTYYPAAVNPSGVIVLQHWARGDQGDWTEIAFWLQNRGLGGQTPPSEPWRDLSMYPPMNDGESYGVFTFNFRGCEGGCSAFYPDGWMLDAQAAMETAMGLEGADPQRIFAIGASIGADGAVLGCLWLNENYPGSCQGAIAISPGSYLALPYDDVVSELTDLGDTPLLCYYGKEDTESADTCESATGDKIPFPGAGHGLELLPKLWIPDSNIQLFGEKATGMEILVDVIRFAFGVDE